MPFTSSLSTNPESHCFRKIKSLPECGKTAASNTGTAFGLDKESSAGTITFFVTGSPATTHSFAIAPTASSKSAASSPIGILVTSCVNKTHPVSAHHAFAFSPSSTETEFRSRVTPSSAFPMNRKEERARHLLWSPPASSVLASLNAGEQSPRNTADVTHPPRTHVFANAGTARVAAISETCSQRSRAASRTRVVASAIAGSVVSKPDSQRFTNAVRIEARVVSDFFEVSHPKASQSAGRIRFVRVVNDTTETTVPNTNAAHTDRSSLVGPVSSWCITGNISSVNNSWFSVSKIISLTVAPSPSRNSASGRFTRFNIFHIKSARVAAIGARRMALAKRGNRETRFVTSVLCDIESRDSTNTRIVHSSWCADVRRPKRPSGENRTVSVLGGTQASSRGRAGDAPAPCGTAPTSRGTAPLSRCDTALLSRTAALTSRGTALLPTAVSFVFRRSSRSATVNSFIFFCRSDSRCAALASAFRRRLFVSERVLCKVAFCCVTCARSARDVVSCFVTVSTCFVTVSHRNSAATRASRRRVDSICKSFNSVSKSATFFERAANVASKETNAASFVSIWFALLTTLRRASGGGGVVVLSPVSLFRTATQSPRNAPAPNPRRAFLSLASSISVNAVAL